MIIVKTYLMKHFCSSVCLFHSGPEHDLANETFLGSSLFLLSLTFWFFFYDILKIWLRFYQGKIFASFLFAGKPNARKKTKITRKLASDNGLFNPKKDSSSKGKIWYVFFHFFYFFWWKMFFFLGMPIHGLDKSSPSDCDVIPMPSFERLELAGRRWL